MNKLDWWIHCFDFDLIFVFEHHFKIYVVPNLVQISPNIGNIKMTLVEGHQLLKNPFSMLKHGQSENEC